MNTKISVLIILLSFFGFPLLVYCLVDCYDYLHGENSNLRDGQYGMAYGMYYFIAFVYYIIYTLLAIALFRNYETEHSKARIIGTWLVVLVLATTTFGLFIL
jgi:hypothetical protein